MAVVSIRPATYSHYCYLFTVAVLSRVPVHSRYYVVLFSPVPLFSASPMISEKAKRLLTLTIGKSDLWKRPSSRPLAYIKSNPVRVLLISVQKSACYLLYKCPNSYFRPMFGRTIRGTGVRNLLKKIPVGK